MNICFSQSSIGYSHITSGAPCQDFSASYSDAERAIVTACDGHGSTPYFRSDRGSKFASFAVLDAFRDTCRNQFRGDRSADLIEKLRLTILCNWNALVETDLQKHPIAKKETAGLTAEKEHNARKQPERAYGSTLGGAMILGNKIVLASLGDGGCFLLKKGDCIPAFSEENEEQIANITYSLCQEDAFRYLKVGVFDLSCYDGVLLCTDGTINPYRNLMNFNQSFVKPVVRNLLQEKTEDVSNFINDLGSRIGIGDDVSLGIILKPGINGKYYRK